MPIQSLRKPKVSATVNPSDAPVTMADMRSALQTHSGKSARELWCIKNMSDLPEIYRKAMPVTSDPDKLMAAEHQLRQAYKGDMKTHAAFHVGALSVNPDGSIHGPSPDNFRARMGQIQAAADLARASGKEPESAAAPVLEQQQDLSKLTTAEKIALGLSQSKPARRAPDSTLSMVSTQTRKPSPGGTGGGTAAGVYQGFGGNRSPASANQNILAGLAASRPAQSRR